MKIGIIGSGNMGSGLGRAWAARGHQVFFSFARDTQALEALAQSAGPNARVGTPLEAAQFGEVVLLTVPWGALATALQAAGPLDGKTLISCVNSLKSDLSGLEVGTTTSAAEEVAKLAPGARVVESLFSFARQVQSGSLRFGSQQSTVYYCGDDPAAKAVVAGLIAELDAEPVDAGPLMSARYLEPASMLMVQLGYKQGLGDKIAIKLLRRQ